MTKQKIYTCAYVRLHESMFNKDGRPRFSSGHHVRHWNPQKSHEKLECQVWIVVSLRSTTIFHLPSRRFHSHLVIHAISTTQNGVTLGRMTTRVSSLAFDAHQAPGDKSRPPSTPPQTTCKNVSRPIASFPERTGAVHDAPDVVGRRSWVK